MKILKQHGSHVIKLTLAFIVATTLLLWGWNTAVPDLFGLPAIQFKQALGLMILLVIASVFTNFHRNHDRNTRVTQHHPGPVVDEDS
jgi:hypothetical protein